MLHQMKLFEKPFSNIKNGTKTIEFRLYNEKRQNLRVGDKIEFLKLPDLKEKITVKVLGLYSAKNFKELFGKFFEDEEEIQNHLTLIDTIYSKEEQEKYEALGIKIKIDTDDLKEQIEKYQLYNEQEEKDKEIMLKYMNQFDDCLTRQNGLR